MENQSIIKYLPAAAPAGKSSLKRNPAKSVFESIAPNSITPIVSLHPGKRGLGEVLRALARQDAAGDLAAHPQEGVNSITKEPMTFKLEAARLVIYGITPKAQKDTIAASAC
jgi:hypothetical protein